MDEKNCCDHPQGDYLYTRNKKDLIVRMRRVEGQIGGIIKMIDENRYCVDIMLQISAARAGLQKVGLALLKSHTQGCVVSAVKEGREDEMIKELIDVLERFTK